MSSIVRLGSSSGLDLDEAIIQKVKASLRGGLVRPHDDSYEEVRKVFNGMIDKRPALVAQCAGAADVLVAVELAHTHALEVAVRGGGHSVAGKSVCDGGLLIDLAPMRGIRVDPHRCTVQAQPGLLLSDLDHETHAFGLATPLGVVSLTGIAGLTLGGGIGWLNGRYGLTCDNVLAVDIVTADGQLLRASHDENEDLFWGIRGGGGNFGIVTSFEYRLHPVEHVIVADAWYDLTSIKSAREVLRSFDVYAAACPDEVTTMASFSLMSDGTPVVKLTACYCGDPEKGAAALAPLASFGSPVQHVRATIRYVDLQGRSSEYFPSGRFHYWKGSSLRSFSDEAIDIIREFTLTVPSLHTETALQQVHGAAARVPTTATAFAHRYDYFDFILLSTWEQPSEAEKNLAWTRAFWKALQPVLGNDVYVNNLGEEGEERVRAAYGPNYGRLAALKRKYDPMNFFHLNHNVKPA